MNVKQKDYSGSYTAINAFHGFGVAVVCVGVVVALLGVSGVSAASRFSGGPNIIAMLGAALPGLGIIVAGIFNLVFAKMAEASVHTAEMTQQLLLIAIRARDDADRPEPIARVQSQSSGRPDPVTDDARGSLPDVAPLSKADPTPTRHKATKDRPTAEAQPKVLRPLGGKNPEQADGDVLETYRDVKIYKRETGIFIGSQWYPGLDAAKQAIDQHEEDKPKK